MHENPALPLSSPASVSACAPSNPRTFQKTFPFKLSLPIFALIFLCWQFVAPVNRAAAQDSVSQPAIVAPDPQPQQTAPAKLEPVPWLSYPVLAPGKPMTSGQKFSLYAHQSFGPPAFFAPAFGAAIRMANPPSQYPRAWKDGAGAFGRIYGSTLATQTSKHTAEFLTADAFHYDSRYYPSHSTETLPRIGHALAFVVVQKTDSGGTALALPHFAGAAAGGFVGMAYLPPGYDSLSRAGQRAGSELAEIALKNLTREFAPELAPIARKIHLPKIVPVWWTPEQASHTPKP